MALLACGTASAATRNFENPQCPVPPTRACNTSDTGQQFAPASVQRQDTPTDPDYDQSEADDQDGQSSTNFFKERFDLFGFPSLLTSATATYADSVHGHTTGQAQVSGFNAAGAWKAERGRSDVSVAILDTGIRWDNTGLRDQARLNTKELPQPNATRPTALDGANCATYTGSGYDIKPDGAVNVEDYACDSRVSVTEAGRHGPSGLLTAEDLILEFSDGQDGYGASAGGGNPGPENNGFVDDIAGWDFFDDDNNPFDQSSYFAAHNHGTGRTGEAVEKGNDAAGSLGVCPHCQFVPIRVWDTFVADANNFGMGMIYAADNGINVLEGSDGALYHSAFAEAASQYAYGKGVAQTYSGDDLNTGNHNYPANYNHTMEIQGVVTDVEGLGEDSGGGAQIFEGLCNPPSTPCQGSNLPVKTYFRGANTTQFGGHSSVSMEGPTGSTNTGKASGAAALVVSAGKDAGVDLTPDETREIIEQTAEDVTAPNTVGSGTPDPAPASCAMHIDCWSEHFGWGRVDLGMAVSVAKSGNLPPTASIDTPDWYAPLVGASQPLTGRIRAHDGGSFHYQVQWGVGLAPTTWNDVTPVTAASGTVTSLGTLDLNAIRAALKPPSEGGTHTVAQDTGGPVFSASSRNPYQDQFAVRVVAYQGAAIANCTNTGCNTGVDRKVLTALPDGQNLRAGFPKRLGTGGEAPIRYHDLNGDGVQELVVPTEDGKIHAYEPNGSELAGWPVQTQVHFSAAAHGGAPAFNVGGLAIPHEPPRGPTIADLDDDGIPEVVTAAGLRIYVFEPDGSQRPGFPVRNNPDFCRPQDEAQHNDTTDFSYRHKCGFLATPAVGRLEGAGKPLDIVAASLDGHLYALRGNGTSLPGFPLELVDPGRADAAHQDHAELINDPAIGDLNGDGKDDIVEASNEVYGGLPSQDDVSFAGFFNAPANLPRTRVYAVDGSNAHIMSGWPIKPTGVILDTLPLIGPGHDAAITDVNGQRRIVSSVTSGSLATYKPDGTQDQLMQQGSGLNLFESASVGNVLGTPASLAVVKYQVDAAQAANLLLVGQNAAYSHRIGAFDASSGASLPNYPNITDDYQFLSASNIAKIDPVGPTNQIVAGNGLGMLHAYDGATGQDVSGFPKVTGGWLFAPAALSDDGRIADITREGFLFEWGTTAPACQSEWPSFRHDPHGSGNYNHDGTPPSAPYNGNLANSTTLNFNAPGDDWLCGTATKYEVRHSSNPITAANFAQADPINAQPPTPAPGRTQQTLTLPADAKAYVAIRAIDDQGNVGRPLVVPTGKGPANPGHGGSTGALGGLLGGLLGGGSGAQLPVITSLSELRSRFAVGISSTALSARRRRSTPRGTEFRYTLNKAATVKIRIERLLAGRKVGRKCLAATRRRRSKPRCTRFSLAGTLTRKAKAGSNRTAFSGRIGRRALSLGRYRAAFTAFDAAGARSAPRHVTFTIVRR
ncbi:MAG: cell wall-associated protease [Solirubrobacteraceae bacterium]|nr:cell wall-associated protease [Solirubrobacteraceae bacterium]